MSLKTGTTKRHFEKDNIYQQEEITFIFILLLGSAPSMENSWLLGVNYILFSLAIVYRKSLGLGLNLTLGLQSVTVDCDCWSPCS